MHWSGAAPQAGKMPQASIRAPCVITFSPFSLSGAVPWKRMAATAAGQAVCGGVPHPAHLHSRLPSQSLVPRNRINLALFSVLVINILCLCSVLECGALCCHISCTSLPLSSQIWLCCASLFGFPFILHIAISLWPPDAFSNKASGVIQREHGVNSTSRNARRGGQAQDAAGQQRLIPAALPQAYPSLKPLASWMRDLCQRVEQFACWAQTAHPPTLFWLPGFTFPTGFLTAVLQASARQNNVSTPYMHTECTHASNGSFATLSMLTTSLSSQ